MEEWPLRGGANGSLRFEIELKHAANAGISVQLSACVLILSEIITIFIYCFGNYGMGLRFLQVL